MYDHLGILAQIGRTKFDMDMYYQERTVYQFWYGLSKCTSRTPSSKLRYDKNF